MTIGLIRHFKVNAPIYNHRMTSDEFNQTQRYYDSADVIKEPADIGSKEWQVCYSSTMKRAQETAQHIYKGNIISTDLIVEVDCSAAFNTMRKLSFTLWILLARIAWVFGSKSQKESRRMTRSRCREFYEILMSLGEENILVVSHGFFMKELSAYLLKNGFKGSCDFAPKNAKLYTFTRT